MGIAIFGGTFDPIHMGHLIIAEQAYNDFDLEQIIFMPAGQPPHKANSNLTRGKHRLEMVKLAVSDNQHFNYSRLEFKKRGKSYTVDTLDYMKELYPDREISFLIGADSLLDIFNWRRPEYLLENASFIVARRPDFSLKDIFLDERFREYRNSISLLDNSLIDISSSQIRALYRKNKSVRYLILPVIKRYVEEHNLYRGD
ncbi:MAG: nicotinate-nucleotide adenylyltransferase [Bacillota bacterium]